MAFGRNVAITASRSIVGAIWYALDTFNPVNILIRHAPSIVATPVKYMREEVQDFASYLLSPRESMVEIIKYFAKKPIRQARLPQALGVPIDPLPCRYSKLIMRWIKLKN